MERGELGQPQWPLSNTEYQAVRKLLFNNYFLLPYVPLSITLALPDMHKPSIRNSLVRFSPLSHPSTPLYGLLPRLSDTPAAKRAVHGHCCELCRLSSTALTSSACTFISAFTSVTLHFWTAAHASDCFSVSSVGSSTHHPDIDFPRGAVLVALPFLGDFPHL